MRFHKSGLVASSVAMLMAARDMLDLTILEPDPVPELEAELAAEVGRLTAGEDGQSEIEKIYRDWSGPVMRRKAVMQVSSPRLGACVQRHVKKGATELTVVCMPYEVVLEVAYAPRADWLRDGPVAQRKITLPLLKAERGPREMPPNGKPEKRPR